VTRLGFSDLIAAGRRGVTRYTGTLLAVFVVQSLLALAVIAAVAVVLSQMFAHLPMWDEAVDGDLVALIGCIAFGKYSFYACAGIVLAGILLWQLATWFLVGGLLGVLAQKPEGRGDTARCFGASGASTYLKYARLTLCSVPSWLLVMFVLGVGLGIVKTRIYYALSISELTGAIVLGALPAVLLLHIVWTITDYARVELSLRHDSHDPGVVMTYLRTVAYVMRRPLTLVHGALGWILFAVITVGYAYLAQGHPMYGAEGAVTLFVIRQGVSLARMGVRVVVIGGQVELGRTRALPPRRATSVADAKA
jgi:hypothetical protein